MEFGIFENKVLLFSTSTPHPLFYNLIKGLSQIGWSEYNESLSFIDLGSRTVQVRHLAEETEEVFVYGINYSPDCSADTFRAKVSKLVELYGVYKKEGETNVFQEYLNS